jgi:Tfp pilus assembly protein PilV
MSLIEVLLAMAIFLMCLSVIGSLVDFAGINSLRAQYQNTGTRLAMSKLAEVEAGVIGASAGGSGDFSADGDIGWNWEVTSTPSDIPNLYTVTVTASRPFQGQTFSVVITQSLFDPQLMGTGAEAQPPEPPSSTEGM